MSLIAELKRRSVFKVGAAYLVVAWLVIQAASIAFPTFQAPDWALRVFIFVLMLGFPVALVIAWAVELTPEGIKLDAAPTGNKRMFGIAAALLVLAVVWYQYGAHDRSPSTPGGVDATSSRSIAVLPFVNMSGDTDNEYFSDGISEEILNSLAQMPGLQVAARTSSFSFKGHTKEIPDIARELEVRMVLEGSVRKQGERVRITAQLIDASKGFHVWSQTYDRDLKDIFAIQDEIAHAIANELQIKLSAAHNDAADTKDLLAYEEYLKGMQLWQAREEPNLRAAEKLFRSALARDPDFAKAWAGLALAWLVLPEWSKEPLAPAWAIARDAAEHASALDPSLPEPYAVLGYIALADFRVATGKALFARAHLLAPSYATGWQWNGEGLFYAGDLPGAIEATRRATQLDPKSAVVRQAHANGLFFAGRDAESVAVCESVLKDFPNWLNCHLIKYDVAIWRKDHATARAVLRELAASRGPEALKLADAMSDALEGKGDARAVAQRISPMIDGTIDPSSILPLSDVDTLLWLVVADQTQAAVPRVRTLQRRLPYSLRGSLFDVHFDSLHCLPEVQTIAKDVGFPEGESAIRCERSKQPRRAPPPAPPKKS